MVNHRGRRLKWGFICPLSLYLSEILLKTHEYNPMVPTYSYIALSNACYA